MQKESLSLYKPCHHCPPPTSFFPHSASDLPSRSVITITPSTQLEPNQRQLGQMLATPQTKPERNRITKACPNTALDVLGLSSLSSLIFSSFSNIHCTPNSLSSLFFPSLWHQFLNPCCFMFSLFLRPTPFFLPPSSHLCPACAITLAVANVSWQLLCVPSKGICTTGSGNGSTESTPYQDVAVATSSTKTHTPFYSVAPSSEQNTPHP